MKLVLVGPIYPYRGGISHFNSQLAQSLIEHGHDVHMFSFRRQYPGWLYPGASDKEIGSSTTHIEAEFFLDPIYPWTWVKTAAAIEKIDPEAVLIHWWTTFWSPAYWSLVKLLYRSGREIIYIIHNVAPHEPLPWDNWLAKNVLRLGKAHIVQSENEKARLDALIPGSKSAICPHPLYKQFLGEKQISKEEARLQLGVKKEEPLILFFGIVRPYKGLKFAIQAVSILKIQGILVQLIVAGEFWDDIEEYQELIINLGLTDQISIYNRYIPNEDVRLFFSAADIFVAPYVGGTQSGSVKIAMSFNLPILATDRISDETMLNSDFVHIVQSESSDALADGIKELIHRDPPSEHLSIVSDTSWVVFINTIEKLVGQD